MSHTQNDNSDHHNAQVISRLVNCIVVLICIIVLLIVINITGLPSLRSENNDEEIYREELVKKSPSDLWKAPDTILIAKDSEAELINYGRNLIKRTAYYLGPSGLVAKNTNGMNCQNCHLDAGTKPFGNNYSGVASTYPKFRERSGTMETIEKRVTDCFERSLNGKAPDSSSKEMRAIVSYIKWLGKDVPKGKKPKGVGLTEVPFIARAADPEKGKKVYALKCAVCHLKNGDGKLNADGITYQYPPLWGEHSYNTGAGLFRLSRFAGYVKSNMPNGTDFEDPQLTDEEAWDVAAYVNSQPRPKRDLSKDWPKISGKPIDHPFGPFADKFSEQQHKYGPFEEIAAAKAKSTTNKNK